jgi:hypothetical protein
MCSTLNPSSFNFTGPGQSAPTTCGLTTCCCAKGNWGVKMVTKGGAPCSAATFSMREGSNPTVFLSGTLTCNTKTVGTYKITLNCNTVLTATVS